jgi:hypothetical protein
LNEPEPKCINWRKMEYWNNGILKKQYSNIPLFQEKISIAKNILPKTHKI